MPTPLLNWHVFTAQMKEQMIKIFRLKGANFAVIEDILQGQQYLLIKDLCYRWTCFSNYFKP